MRIWNAINEVDENAQIQSFPMHVLGTVRVRTR